MKKITACILALSFIILLVGCGSPNSKYDEKIDVVVEDTSKTLTTVYEKERNLKREECNFLVYEGKNYVYMEYPAKKDSKKLSKRLYKIDNKNEVSMIALSYRDGLEADYEEYNAK
ncbi:hypothetical protein JT279_001732 [Listeria monocytogenes]|uniref:hypothetical protein n=1 Tax=Listeria monocytogenes TaxID=1639 RepID=UPI000E6C2BA9|nr:hypothetical protein [Listeria monocytogenes]MBC1624142.1 hypothetical protein [Listeria welshimeri]EAE6587917.1 hypothetical protein [Listeria monocytogenes]EHB7034385.1 hypothetical protein [Listeria monocytogenes]EHB7062942.1 hypothetical protein [Listeria monocytogenes]EHB7087516.1 hypothetical protein [Listeria monocytogenes]